MESANCRIEYMVSERSVTALVATSKTNQAYTLYPGIDRIVFYCVKALLIHRVALCEIQSVSAWHGPELGDRS